jgi:hypothetical protein
VATRSAIWLSSVSSPGAQRSDPPPHISVSTPRAGEGKRAEDLSGRAELEGGAEGVADGRAEERPSDAVAAVHVSEHSNSRKRDGRRL